MPDVGAFRLEVRGETSYIQSKKSRWFGSDRRDSL